MSGKIFCSLIHELRELWPASNSYYQEKIPSFSARLIIYFLKISALLSYHWARCFYSPTAEIEEIPTISFTEATKIPPQTSNKCAVVIPMFIKEECNKSQIKRLLEQLAWQTKVPDVVVIVDAASQYAYEEKDIVPLKYELNLKIVKLEKNMGPAFARNHGVKVASDCKPALILFTDHDCIPDIRWVEGAFEAYTHHKELFANENFLLSGITRSYGNTWFDIYHDIYSTLNGRYLPHDENSLLYGPACNLAVPFTLAENILFDTNFKSASLEDVELCIRARKIFSAKTWPASEMKVEHDFGYYTGEEGDWQRAMWNFYKNWRKFCRRFSKYGKWDGFMYQKHPDYYTWLSSSESVHVM